MYEEAERKRKEEAQQSAAALIIQQHWRLFTMRREEEKELLRTQNSAGGGGGGIGGGDMEVLTDAEKMQHLVGEYTTLLEERGKLLEKNLACQRVAAKHFLYQRVRKGENESGEPVTLESEENYWSAIRRSAEERRRVHTKKIMTEEDLEAERVGYQGLIDSATHHEEAFRSYIQSVSASSVFLRSRDGFPQEKLEAFLSTDKEQRQAIQSARVRYIQLRNFLHKISRSEKNKENHHEGMYLIDFEQLKIENTNLNEKIEERNEDLVKLRRKVTTTIHVLTHVKEKLEFMKGENNQLRQQVQQTEEELNGVRDQLAQTKRRRDGFLKANLKMKERMPLVGSEDLLMDYEQRKASINQTRIHVVELTEQHKQLLGEIEKQQPILDRLRRDISRCPV